VRFRTVRCGAFLLILGSLPFSGCYGKVRLAEVPPPTRTPSSILQVSTFVADPNDYDSLEIHGGLNFNGTPARRDVAELRTMPADPASVEAVLSILRCAGVTPDFRILAARVAYAQSAVGGRGRGDEQFIFFDPQYLQSSEEQAGPWARTFVLAHEVGHHVNGDLSPDGPSRRFATSDSAGAVLELRADRWAGRILYKLGASRNDISGLLSIIPASKNPTLDPRSRVDAALLGWDTARFEAPPSCRSTVGRLVWERLGLHLRDHGLLDGVILFPPSGPPSADTLDALGIEMFPASPFGQFQTSDPSDSVLNQFSLGSDELPPGTYGNDFTFEFALLPTSVTLETTVTVELRRPAGRDSYVAELTDDRIVVGVGECHEREACDFATILERPMAGWQHRYDWIVSREGLGVHLFVDNELVASLPYEFLDRIRVRIRRGQAWVDSGRFRSH